MVVNKGSQVTMYFVCAGVCTRVWKCEAVFVWERKHECACVYITVDHAGKWRRKQARVEKSCRHYGAVCVCVWGRRTDGQTDREQIVHIAEKKARERNWWVRALPPLIKRMDVCLLSGASIAYLPMPSDNLLICFAFIPISLCWTIIWAYLLHNSRLYLYFYPWTQNTPVLRSLSFVKTAYYWQSIRCKKVPTPFVIFNLS